MKQALRGIGAALLVIGGALALNAWCVAWVAAFVWLADMIPGDGVLQRLALLGAAGAGLWISMLIIARVTHSRL